MRGRDVTAGLSALIAFLVAQAIWPGVKDFFWVWAFASFALGVIVSRLYDRWRPRDPY